MPLRTTTRRLLCRHLCQRYPPHQLPPRAESGTAARAASFLLSRAEPQLPQAQGTMKFSTTFALLSALSVPSAHAFVSAGKPFGVPSTSASTTLRSTAAASYSTAVVGEEGTESFRLTFSESDSAVSPWHDIPLSSSDDDSVFNMVVEIPKMTKAKMEVATKEEQNPIAQDIKKGVLRDYHGPIFWNYGCLPQTWEDPNVKHPELGCFGDDDPIDVVEIGSAALPMGSVTPVKILGVLAMIDDGELDWKVVAVSTEDPLASEYSDIDDVPKAVQDGIREWFRWYKTPDDKPLNEFGFDEKFLDVAATKEIIAETHEAWQKLRSGDTDAGKLWTGK